MALYSNYRVFYTDQQKVEIPSMPVDSDGKLIKDTQICRF